MVVILRVYNIVRKNVMSRSLIYFVGGFMVATYLPA